MSKSKYPISEKKLSLSDEKFEEYIKKSKAKSESIRRYYRAREQYQKDIKQQEDLEKIGITINKYIQKEVSRNIARTVILASKNCNILITKKANKRNFNKLYKEFVLLHNAKENASAMTLKVMFNDILNDGTQMNIENYISTTLYTTKSLELAFNELKYKILSALNKYPDRSMLIKRCTIKFYYAKIKIEGE